MSRSPYGSPRDCTQVQRPTLNGQLSMSAPVITDHAKLTNRDGEDQHPIGAITNLEATLDNKLEGAGFISNLEIQEILNS